jgi:hypothetical protein
MNIEDVILFGVGKELHYKRLLRHFTVILYNEMEETAISRIFTLLCDYSLRRFNEKVRDSIPFIIESTIQIFKAVR